MGTFAKRNNRVLMVALVALLVITGQVFASPDPPARMFVFGDSLSDPGNIWLTTSGTSMAPYAPVPDFPYTIGGHHYSNGKTWAEQLAIRMAMNTSGMSAVKQPGHFGNYAFGGARARAVSSFPPTSELQVAAFLADYQGVAPSDALYVVQFGGNDVFDALVDPDNAVTIAIQAASTIVGVVNELYAAGARHFLVGNAPNLGQVPAVLSLGEPAISGATGLCQFYNLVLEFGFDTPTMPSLHVPGLMDLDALPDITIDRFDLFGFVDEVAANPEVYGINDVFFPCLLFGVTGSAKCNDASERLFWDAIHPTTAGHSALADIAEASLTCD
jgi:phospholipase/lecithinase/hemolysin